MKYIPCVCAAIAGLVVIIAVCCRVGDVMFLFKISPRGLLLFAGVMLLFGINASLCPQASKGNSPDGSCKQ